MATERDIRLTFERIKGVWKKFSHPKSTVDEWCRSFRDTSPAALNDAVSRYIDKCKFEPRIADIKDLVIIPKHARPHADMLATRRERWRYIKSQAAKGLYYVRERHTTGLRCYFARSSEVETVGLWVFEGQSMDRHARHDETNIGRGEAWAF